MKFNKTVLGTTFALSALFAAAGFNTEDAKAAEWSARSVEEISADMETVDESTSSYTVVYGDTLSAIAKAADVDVNTLVKINEIENADLIFPTNTIEVSKNDQGEVDQVVIEDANKAKDTYKVEEETVEKTEAEPTVEPVSYEAEEEVVEEASYEEETPAVEETTEETGSSSSYSAAEEIPYQVLQVVETEAGPSYSEKAAVFSVILNRANSGNWGGTTLSAVVNASGQFEVVSNGMAASATVSDQTYAAVNDVLTNGVTTSAESFRASGDGVTNRFF